MAQVEPSEIVRRAVASEVPAAEAVAALVDRDKGSIRLPEGQLVDFKISIDTAQMRTIGELAKDVLGFANAQGGFLLFGVDDTGKVRGHSALNKDALRAAMGPCVGTRVTYEIGVSELTIQGVMVRIPFILVHRTTSAHPLLLRCDVEIRTGLLQKVKYLRGSLPYREGSETKVEPAGGDIADAARSLGFTFVTPRTISSFLVVEDRPGVRLYGHINDRFFGREEELRTLVAQFEDARGRGVSIGGLGGIGKTELGIALVRKLYQQGRFRRVYSGSAKRMVLGPLGVQHSDPMFHDYPSFLQDLAGWLGIQSAGLELSELESACLHELEKSGKVLLFTDNLETLEDTRVFEFLNRKLPANVWIVATSRVHRVKNYIFPCDLGQMEPRDAAKLLRHELKRQGLDDLANKDINELQRACEPLLFHPLAIRWFAWACKKDPQQWTRGPGTLPRDELEDFCVGHTLANLSSDAVDVLAAIAASQGHAEVDTVCVATVAAKRADAVDRALYELESAGLITVSTNPNSGRSTYEVSQLALTPIREITRQREMEATLAARLKSHVRRPLPPMVDPLVRYLANIDVVSVKGMPREDIQELLQRIERAKKSAGGFELELMHLEAECERQLDHPITADDLYRQAAERILAAPPLLGVERFQRLLLEAATVARQRGMPAAQLHPITVRYLEALPDHRIAPLRIPGMLCEAHAGLKNKAKYEQCREVVKKLLESDGGGFSDVQREQAEAALARAEQALRTP